MTYVPTRAAREAIHTFSPGGKGQWLLAMLCERPAGRAEILDAAADAGFRNPGRVRHVWGMMQHLQLVRYAAGHYHPTLAGEAVLHRLRQGHSVTCHPPGPTRHRDQAEAEDRAA